jgi:hypothetical protein
MSDSAGDYLVWLPQLAAEATWFLERHLHLSYGIGSPNGLQGKTRACSLGEFL